MQKQRLLKLADFLMTVKPKRFYMGSFIGGQLNCKLEEKECKATACAFGWATVAFPRSKLKLDPDTYTVLYTNKEGRYEDFEAAEVFFGLTKDQSTSLFLPYDNHTTPKQVAKNIRKFVLTGALPR